MIYSCSLCAYYTTSQYALDKHWASHLPIED